MIQGRQEGMQQGIQQGVQQGMQQGMHQTKIQTARKMLELGYSSTNIAVIVGLSAEEVASLLEETS